MRSATIVFNLSPPDSHSSPRQSHLDSALGMYENDDDLEWWPQDWNGYFYPVTHGVRPGIYLSWRTCLDAIGLENYTYGRGKWCKLTDLQECVRMMQITKEVPESDSTERLIDRDFHPGSNHQQQTTVAAAGYADELSSVRRERKRSARQMDQIKKKLEDALRKIARLEKETPQHQQPSLRSSLHCVMDKLEKVQAGANVGCQFVCGDYAAAYIRGKIFENPTAKHGDEAAGFGVWFSDTSVWNVGSAWLEEFPLSRNNVEIVAALVAIKIAADFLGQKKLYIYTRSEFLTDQAHLKWNTEDESHQLLQMLRNAVESMDDVGWVLSPSQDTGIQNAKQLAVRAATITAN